MAYVRKRCKCPDQNKCDHSWYYTIDANKDPVTGERKQKSKGGFKTEKEAMRAAMKAEELVEKGLNVSVPKLEDYIRKYLDTTVKNEVAGSTYEQQKQFSETYIIPYLGRYTMDKINYEKIDDFYNHLLSTGESRGLIKNIAMVLRKTFRAAETREVIHKNIVRNVRPPKYKAAKMKVWNKEEVQMFISKSKNFPFHAAYVVALLGGLRLGEILGLYWDDVNWMTGKLRIDRKVKYDKAKGLFIDEDLKNESSRRTITLPGIALDTLKRHQETTLPHKLIFHNLGELIYPSEMSRRFSLDVKKTNLPLIRFHDMRHTHATLLLQDGHNAKVVSERLGHSSVNTLLNTYAHVLPSMEQEVADRLDQMFDL